MNGLLSTDELLKLLNEEVTEVKVLHKDEYVPIPKIKGRYKVIYWFFLAIALLHVIYISLLFFSPQKGMNIFGESTYLAVSFNQPVIENRVVATISIIGKIEFEDLEVGNLVAFFGKYGQDVLVVEQVAVINEIDSTIITSSDGVVESSSISFSSVVGLYQSEANIFETIIFVSLNLRGYLITVGSYVLMFGLIYIFYIRKPKDKPIVKD